MFKTAREYLVSPDPTFARALQHDNRPQTFGRRQHLWGCGRAHVSPASRERRPRALMGYLYRFVKPEHAYFRNWQELRFRKRLFCIAYAAAIPATALIWLILSPLASLLGPQVSDGITAILVFTALAALYLHLVRWPCPRCGKPFSVTWGTRGGFNDKCVRCGLPLNAPCDPAEQQWEFESHLDERSTTSR